MATRLGNAPENRVSHLRGFWEEVTSQFNRALPYLNQAQADRFAFRNHPKVKLLADIELREETAVGKVYASVSKLWASIHIAGGFAMAPITETPI